MHIRIIPTLLFALLLVASSACSSAEEPAPHNQTGAPTAPAEDALPPSTSFASDFEAFEVPDFELDLMEGGTFRMADHIGEVVVINFWATWCSPCRFEIPELIELQEEYGSEGLTILGVSTDEGGFDVVRPFAEEMQINYPLVIDEGPIGDHFGGIYALPTTYIVDRAGVVRERVLGLVTRSSLEPRLQILLSQPV